MARQHSQNVFPLAHPQPPGGARVFTREGCVAHWRRQILYLNSGPCSDRAGAFDRVFELANVPGPRVVEDPIEGRWGVSDEGATQALHRLRQEFVGEGPEILWSFAQWGNVHIDHS